MIISHQHKFIFLKTRKTAGTSVEIVLSQLCGPDDIITPISPNDELARANGRGPQNWRVHGWWQSQQPLLKRHWFKVSERDYGFYNHIAAPQARTLLNDDKIWQSYFKFTFDRNPWDRQVSWYHHRYRHNATPPPFSTFIHSDRRARINNYEIYTIGEQVAVDFVGRFESLEQDLRHALAQVGITFEPELPRAKGNFRKTGKHYRDYYDDETRDIVAKWYAPEVALLDYEF